MDSLLDVAGVGAGPFNLSVAALLAPVARIRSRFFDRRAGFDWHPGMMLPGARLQTSFLKDLVTAADPTSPYSFLAYLVSQRRFYRFINAEFSHVERREFADYLRWVAQQLPNVQFGSTVREVTLASNGFRLRLDDGSARARDLVVATGTTPRVPAWAAPCLGARCQHTQHYLSEPLPLAGLHVVVIGGGQSGAEVVIDLLSGQRGELASLTWLSRRQTLEALDESPFANEFFTPHYVEAFHRLPHSRKPAIVARQKLASDGISPDTLRQLYQLLYNRSFLQQAASPLRILPQREVYAMQAHGSGWQLMARNGFDGGSELLHADSVILATGYQTVLPECLTPLREQLQLDGEGRFVLARDFSAQWQGPAPARLFVQNGGRYSHGIADPQLSLAAWRGATIANAILGEARYVTEDAALPIEWESRHPQALADLAG